MHRIQNIKRAIQILSTNTVMTPEPGPKSWRNKQPDQSLRTNCTVVVIDSDPKLYMKWYVVPCNGIFAATYICQPTLHQPNTQSINLQNPHFSCERDWFRFVNHSKCYTMIRSPPTLTFDAAAKSCSLMNSSLVNLVSYGNAGTMEDEFKMARAISHSKMKWSDDLFSDIYNFFESRQALENSHPLLSFIKFSSEYQLTNIRILVSVNGRCTRAEYPNFSFGGSRRWTAVSCGDYTLPTDVFICEKPSVTHTTIMCNTEYYQCEDGTCILLLYVCDSVDDCLGGEDETLCDPVVLQQPVFSFLNNSLYLPCLMYLNCNDIFGPLVPPIKLHTICDGLMSHVIMLDEDDLCIKRRVENINLSQLIVNTKWTFKQEAKFTDDLHELLRLRRITKMEDKSTKEQANKPINQSVMITQSVMDIGEFAILCHKSKHNTPFSDICKVRASGELCALPGRHSMCSYMVCPGMFRCRSLYCIHMSLVCDAQRDCIYGEDEASCTKLSCPGFLKCRGESRCISPDQICDGNVDCIVSFDDEITCGYCPPSCKCDGYLLYCTGDNKTGIVTIIGDTYSKGVILKGKQTILSIDIFLTQSLVFIDVSACKIRQILFASNLQNHVFHQKILFGNFSVNLINDTSFLGAELLSKLVVVDISNNEITLLMFYDLQLEHLTALYAKHNPIIFLEIINGMHSLKYINLQHVKFQWRMTFRTKYFNLKTTVTDSNLCCLWPKEIDCIFDGEVTKCYGIMTNTASLIALISLTVLATIVVLIILTKTLKILIMKSKTKKYYNICIFNHVFASTCCTTCLVCLSIVGILDIHLISWRKSIGCHVLHFIFSISVGTHLAFKCFTVTIITFKIMHPFAHQCRWLKKTFLWCNLIWFIYFLLYSVSILVANVQLKGVIFDNFCSVGECHISKDWNLMYALICSVDCIFLMIICIDITKVTLILRNRNQNVMLSRKLKVFTNIIHLTEKIIPQTLFTFCLYLISLFQCLDNSWKAQYCYGVFSYVLPVIIVVDCILIIH